MNIRPSATGGQRAHPRGEARQAILTHARELFSNKGYDGTNMREVAQRAGVSEALLYRYFKSKATLFEDAVTQPYRRFVETFLEKWESLDRRLSNEEMVARFVTDLYDFLLENRNALFALVAANRFGEREIHATGALSEGVRRLAAFTAAEANERGIEHVDLEMAVSCTIAMVFSMALLDDLLFAPETRHPPYQRLVEGMSRYAAAGVQQIPFGSLPNGVAAPLTRLDQMSGRDVIPRIAGPDTRSAATTLRIVSAARRCFAREGVARTRMNAVAAEAGLARPTLYKFIGSRQELLELALIERCRELLGEFERVAHQPTADIRDDLVEFLAMMIEVTRDDSEFAELAGAMPRENALGLLSGPSELRSLVAEALAPFFDRAQAEGVLRPIRRDELAGLAQTVMTPLTPRRDMDGPALRETLRRLVIPALLRSDDS